MLTLTDSGLFCETGGFYIDPWRPVDRAIITHAHADHARWGSRRYLTAAAGTRVLRVRMGPSADIAGLEYGEPLDLDGVRLSLHPAGHILGSSQVRLEHRGEVWVVSGDYKTAPDPTCAPFEPVRCHTFITESTFGLPVYRWPEAADTAAEINAWWRANQAAGRASVLFGYSLGKAQRLLAGLDAGVGPVFCHGAVEPLVRAYRESGVALPPTRMISDAPKGFDWSRSLVLAPPAAGGTAWMRRFGDVSTAMASGWMRVRGHRRRRAIDRGFVLSDHADWPGLLSAIGGTGASRVLVTHGYTAVLVRHLRERGLEADVVRTPFEGETAEERVADEAAAETPP